jgi:phospholipid N-methyltransferase
MKDRYVASIMPTSPFGVKSVCDKINFKQCRTIIEYGPGTGVFTHYLLKNMTPRTHLIVIERNKNFDAILKNKFCDPRMTLLNDSAENVVEVVKECNQCEVDYVISGIPFLWLSKDVKNKILCNTHRVLRKGGKFLAYQTIFQTSKDLKVHLDRFFSTVKVQYEFMNIPPMCIYEAVK